MALGQLLQSAHSVALERLLPAMEAAAGQLRAVGDAEPSTLRSLAVRNSAALRTPRSKCHIMWAS